MRPSGSRLFSSASSRVSRETVACVTRQPTAASASISSCCVPNRFRSTRLATSFWRSAFESRRSSPCIDRAWSIHLGMATFRSAGARQFDCHAPQGDVDGSLCGPRRRGDDGVTPARLENLARHDRRGTSDEDMTETLKEKLRHELDEDRAFLQKLKPRLIKARAKGELRATAPSSPQLPRPKQPGAGGPNPWLVL